MGSTIEKNKVYDLEEACKTLQLPKSTFRLMLYRGEIKGRKAGRRWVFLGEDLLKLFEKTTSPSRGKRS